MKSSGVGWAEGRGERFPSYKVWTKFFLGWKHRQLNPCPHQVEGIGPRYPDSGVSEGDGRRH